VAQGHHFRTTLHLDHPETRNPLSNAQTEHLALLTIPQSSLVGQH
jgi:hypothetical protein